MTQGEHRSTRRRRRLSRGRSRRRLLDARRRARARRCASSTSKATRPPTPCSTTPTTRPSATAQRHHPRAGQSSISAPAPSCCPTAGRADADDRRRHLSAATTRSAAPARPRATPCATRSRRRRMHACRDSFLLAVAENEQYGLTKRDIAHNINFFMNVPVTPDGGLTLRRRRLGAGQVRGDARRDGRDRADLQLPAAQQPLQRLQPDARSKC